MRKIHHMRRIILLLSVLALFASLAWTQSNSGKKEESSKSKAVDLTDDITPPRLLEIASPEYTDIAKKKHIEGEVVLSIVVNEKGEVKDVKVKKGLGYGLDENAIAAVKVYTYKPAEKDDKPIAVRMDVSMQFYIH